MSVELKVPMLPESVSDATVVNWHKNPGETVKRDETLVDLETDKVVLEVPCPIDGVLQEILKTDGTTVIPNEVLAIIKAGAVVSDVKEIEKPAANTVLQDTSMTTGAALGPAVRRLVAEENVDVNKIDGSGKSGRITREDVVKHLATDNKPAMAETPTVASTRMEKRVPMTRLRARIAERLLEAQHSAAILTTFNEVNMQAVMDLRQRYKDIFEKKHNVKLGFMSFFTKAVVEALKQFPSVNACIDDHDIVYHGFFDIGVAVSTERGLVVPVLRDADQMSMSEIEKNIADYAKRARDSQLSLEEMTGGNFTITNGGIFGSLLSTPILNPPQSAILGLHKIEERPIVEQGSIVIRPMMYLALSYDHRIIDGRESVQFLVCIKNMIEDPARLILEI